MAMRGAWKNRRTQKKKGKNTRHEDKTGDAPPLPSPTNDHILIIHHSHHHAHAHAPCHPRSRTLVWCSAPSQVLKDENVDLRVRARPRITARRSIREAQHASTAPEPATASPNDDVHKTVAAAAGLEGRASRQNESIGAASFPTHQHQAKKKRMADTGGWTTIESDPGLFTELIEAFGVRGVVVEELWALDADSLRQQLGPGGAHGLVFLFKYEQEHYGGGAGGQQQQQQHQQQQQQQEEAAQGGIGEVDVAAGAGAAQGGRVFFARQVIANACATQAILSVLLNRGKMGAGVGGGVGADGAGGLDLVGRRSFSFDFGFIFWSVAAAAAAPCLPASSIAASFLRPHPSRCRDPLTCPPSIPPPHSTNHQSNPHRVVRNKHNCAPQGPELTAFAEFTADFPPDLKGLAIGNSHLIRAQHNAFARPDPLLQDEKRKKEDNEGEAFHFVAYVPRGGTLWELDGLREGPIPLCEATDADWLDKVRSCSCCFCACVCTAGCFRLFLLRFRLSDPAALAHSRSLQTTTSEKKKKKN